jgi:hypothetical protein
MTGKDAGQDMEWTHLDPGHVPPGIDTTKPHAARMYNFYLGGKDNISQGVWIGPYSAPAAVKQ